MFHSAGVGRTGTFITIDHVLEQVEKEGVVDIAGVINKIRTQRMKLVQTVVGSYIVYFCGDQEGNKGLINSYNVQKKENKRLHGYLMKPMKSYMALTCILHHARALGSFSSSFIASLLYIRFSCHPYVDHLPMGLIMEW